MSPHRPARAREAAPVRITTAGADPQADLRRRQRKYVIAMTIRTLCFVGAAATGAAGWHYVWPVLIVGAIVLPYVAVVMANANDSRSVALPLTGGGEAQRILGPGTDDPEDPRGA
jgi:fatty acid desaturase